MNRHQTHSSHYFNDINLSMRKTKTVQEKQADSFRMYRALERHCDKSEQIIALYPDFQISVAIFKTKIAAIIDLYKLQDLQKKRAVAKRLESKNKLCKAGADIAGLILINMKTVSTISLKPEVVAFHNELFKMKDEALAKRIQDIHDSGTANICILAQYGITSSLLNAFQEMIDGYFNPADAREFVEENAEICRNLKTLFKETDILLKEKLDKNISQLRKKNQQFVYAYKETRVIHRTNE
ncbi:hypothetical protein [uncultured Flavobacterium sp.]|uniref:hypothetical protein n=1 Tax=uncultured Flavobacterium sp. TaxID=165435 RepID=UPI0025CEEB46|nr:hypothetical protein [uncultured Flavobacterium sp.]